MPAHERSKIDLLTPAARKLVDELLSTPGEGRPVAFDADGTLWRGDIGEDLLRFLAADDLLPRYRGRRGIYAEYERRVAVDPASAYAWSVEVMEEFEEGRLHEICATFFQTRFEGRVFPWARLLLSELQGRGYVPWIVSASPFWPVVAGAVSLGIHPAQVIGVECVRAQGRLTAEVIQPVPCGPGKVVHLERRGVRPVLAVGNGDLDFDMLAYAERALVVAPLHEHNALVQAANERGWAIQRC